MYHLSNSKLRILGSLIFLMVACEKPTDNYIVDYDREVVDRSGNRYKTVRIGDQIWIASNLKETKLQNGSNIPAATGGTYNVPVLYQQTQINVNKYGQLYNWYAVTAGWDICAYLDFDVPTKSDWQTLINVLGQDAAKKLMSKTDWSNDIKGRDVLRFNAKPSGYFDGASISQQGSTSIYWTKTSSGSANNAPVTAVGISADGVIIGDNVPKQIGASVRCVRPR